MVVPSLTTLPQSLFGMPVTCEVPCSLVVTDRHIISAALPKIPGVDHLDATRTLARTGFRVVRQSKHIVRSDGRRIVTIPRPNPVNAITLGGIVRDVGLPADEFGSLLLGINGSKGTVTAKKPA